MDLMACWNANISDLEAARVAEDSGITHLGVGQGPLLSSDPFQYMALASQRTSTIKLGTLVMDPLTRMPPSTANSIATLNAIAPGRVFCGMGTANNALHSMGRKSATVDELAHAVEVIRAMLRGDRVGFTWRGETKDVALLGLHDGSQNVGADGVPIYIAAGGPKGLANAAKYADVLVYAVGPNENMIKMVREEIDRLVAEAGRPPGSVKVIGLSWFYRSQPGEDWEDALKNGFGTTAPMASVITDMGFLKAHREQIGADIVDTSIYAATGLMGKPADAGATDHLDQWKGFSKGYDPRHAKFMSKELLDFWCLYGDKAEIRDKTQLMIDSGLDGLCLTLYNPAEWHRDLREIGDVIAAA